MPRTSLAQTDCPEPHPGDPPAPHDVFASASSWPLHDTRGTRELEAALLQRWPSHTLMAWAGRRVARWVLAQAPHAKRIWVAAGPGGNGGDGLHAAAHLARQGRQVWLTLHPHASELKPATHAALQLALDAGCELAEPAVQQEADLVIDALLGLGANRPLEPPMADAVRMISAGAIPCLSIDVPTGLHADTGQALGGGLVTARATLSLLTLKPGLLMGSGRDAVGSLWFDSLDQVRQDRCVPSVARTVGPCAVPGPVAFRSHATHKGRFGDVVAVGGAIGMSGAIRMAAHAALAAGAGRVVVACLDPDMPLRDEFRPECMWMRPQDLPRWDLEACTVVCGCGAGPALGPWLPLLLQRSWRLVLDADALNDVAQQADLAAMLRNRHVRGLATVLTPHPLEAARLLGCTSTEVQADRLAAAKRLSSLYAATVVLKGSGTVVCSPEALPEVNVTGNAALATAGTGDVLAGWLAGQWASQEQRCDSESGWAQRIACCAVHLHGLGADRHGARNAVRAGDLVEIMHQLAS